MRKIYYLLILFFSFSVLSAQEELSKEEKARREKNIQAGNPFAKYGSKAPVATLSKGKYLEVHDLDSIVTIGTSRWDVENKKIVGDIIIDSLNVDAQPIGDAPGRWMSPDPLSEEFPSWSPYNMSFNNPIRFVDPDGRAPQECCPDLVKAFKGIYGSVKSEVVGTYNFITSDAYKSETWKGAGNMLLGSMAMSGPAGNIGNAYALDAQFGTNSVGAVQGMTASMESFGNDLTSGDVQKTAGAITTAALFFAPSKLDDLAKIGKLSKVDNVLKETLTSTGNITSKTVLNSSEALEAGIRHVGSNYSEIGNKGSGVYRSNVVNQNGTFNQFRMDNNSLKGSHQPNVPHVHLEVVNPNKSKPIINNHIPFKD
jgi:hypothetical protein